MRAVDIISKKRNKLENTEEEIRFLVNGFVNGEVADYQMSAYLMAVCLNSMTRKETQILTRAMIESGDVIKLDSVTNLKSDKHSTGGVADTTTLILAPLVAACGGTVAKLSGRGLGATGGTIDKLESIPNLNTECDSEKFERLVRENGLCVSSQTASLVPADKLMYALRDVTATVDSIPLIASSIMSKKIAASADVIVLDVKFGNGAFMKTVEEAEALAREMVIIGESFNRKTIAILTDMNEPLGTAVGNGLELKEAIDALSGLISRESKLMQVSTYIAKKMLVLSNVTDSEEKAEKLIDEAIASKKALLKLKELCDALGGDTACFDNTDMLIKTEKTVPIYCGEGYIESVEALKIGNAACLLGAGRQKKTDNIDYSVGLMLHKQRGDYIKENEVVATLYVNDGKRLDEAKKLAQSAFRIVNAPVKITPPIYKTIRIEDIQ